MFLRKLSSFVRRLGLVDRITVRERVTDIEGYLATADLGLFTSEAESFRLSILELMSVAFAVGGIPRGHGVGRDRPARPVPQTRAMTQAAESLLRDPARRLALGRAAQARARQQFSAAAIVPRYEAIYRKVCRSLPRCYPTFRLQNPLVNPVCAHGTRRSAAQELRL
jgi:glycosyltransferase involved in cell wall biosynthesis